MYKQDTCVYFCRLRLEQDFYLYTYKSRQLIKFIFRKEKVVWYNDLVHKILRYMNTTNQLLFGNISHHEPAHVYFMFENISVNQSPQGTRICLDRKTLYSTTHVLMNISIVKQGIDTQKRITNLSKILNRRTQTKPFFVFQPGSIEINQAIGSSLYDLMKQTFHVELYFFQNKSKYQLAVPSSLIIIKEGCQSNLLTIHSLTLSKTMGIKNIFVPILSSVTEECRPGN